MHIGEKIKKLREEKGFTQAELAKRAEIGQPYISKLENQAIKIPSSATIEDLARALNVNILDLIEGTTYAIESEGYAKDGIGFCPHLGCPGRVFDSVKDKWEPYKTTLQDEDGESIDFCIHCGTRLVTECRNCGRRIKGVYAYCPGCGAAIFNLEDDIPF